MRARMYGDRSSTLTAREARLLAERDVQSASIPAELISPHGARATNASPRQNCSRPSARRFPAAGAVCVSEITQVV